MNSKSLNTVLNNRTVIQSANAFLGLLLMAATFLFIREVVVVSFSKPEKEIAVSGRPEQIPMRQNLMNYAPILKNNPFGFPAGELRDLSGGRSSAIIPSRDLTLIGTVSGGKTSYAIFVDKSGAQEVFRKGDSVYEVGILDEVEKGRVFIMSGTGRFEVPLSEIVSIKEYKQAESVTSPSLFSKKLSENSYTIDQKKVQAAIENPGELMTDARLLPNVVNGKQEGFRLREVKKGGIYQSLGLENGDVLLRINEYNMSNPEAGLQAFTALKGMDRLQVDIIRGGSKKTMTYQIR